MISAPVLLGIFDSVYVLALAAWLGSLLFFSFGVAPVIFQVLGAEAGGKFVRALFPRYYLWGVICLSLALASLVCGALAFPELRGSRIAAQEVGLIGSILITLYCGQSLTPAINTARDAGPDHASRFDRLHRRSVQLNGLMILVGLVLVVVFATRPALRTSGILETPPGAPVGLRR